MVSQLLFKIGRILYIKIKFRIPTFTLHYLKDLRKRLKKNFFNKNFTSCYFSRYEYSPNNIQAVVVYLGEGESWKYFPRFT